MCKSVVVADLADAQLLSAFVEKFIFVLFHRHPSARITFPVLQTSICKNYFSCFTDIHLQGLLFMFYRHPSVRITFPVPQTSICKDYLSCPTDIQKPAQNSLDQISGQLILPQCNKNWLIKKACTKQLRSQFRAS